MNDLDRAFRSLGEGRPAEALGFALSAWRAAPDPGIARAVEELSRRAGSDRPPLPRRPARAWAQAAVAAARSRDPLDLPPLLGALPSLDGDLLGEVLAALSGIADPRLTAPLCALAPHVASLDLRALHRLLALLEQARDPRAAALLDAVDLSAAGERRRGAERRLRRARRLLGRAEASPLDARLAASLARLERLLDAACAPPAPPPPGLGPLAPVVDAGATFEDNAPVACRLRADASSRLAPLVGHPAWSTVRLLDVAGLGDPQVLALVTHPAMRSLRALAGVPYPLLEALTCSERPLDLDALDYLGPRRLAWSPPRAAPDEVALLAALPSLPSLRTLGLNGWRLEPAAFRWLWSSALGRRIDRLRVAAELGALPGWRAEAEQHGALSTLELRGASAQWHARLERGSDGRLSRLEAELGRGATREASLPDLARAIAALPDDALTHVAVRAGRVRRADAAELLRVVTRQRRLELADLP